MYKQPSTSSFQTLKAGKYASEGTISKECDSCFLHRVKPTTDHI